MISRQNNHKKTVAIAPIKSWEYGKMGGIKMNQGKIMCNVTDMCTKVDNKLKEMCAIVTDKTIANAEVGNILKEQTTNCTNAREMVTKVGNVMSNAQVHQYFTEQSPRSKTTETTNPRQQAESAISQPTFVNRTIESVYGMNPYINIMHVESLPAEFQYNDEEFQTTQDGKLFYKGKELMNCVVRIIQIISAKTHVEYRCEVYISGRMFEETVSSSIFTSINWLQKKVPGFATKGEKNAVSQAIYKYLNNIVAQCDHNYILEKEKKPGWISVNDKLVYLTPCGTIPVSEKQIVSEYGQCFRNIESGQEGNIHLLLKMAELTPGNWTAPVICLYTVMSFSYSLLKMADILPKFVLFVNGPRGSYKTSMSLILTQLERTESPKYNLKARAAGLETGYKEYKDAVMLVDDLAPTEELRERNIMQSNLELVVRAFGDGTGVKRNYDFQNENFEGEQYEAEGGAVITGEYTTGCESSLARCLFVPLKRNEVNVELLTELQEKKTALSTFLVGYINYLSQQYREIILFLKTRGKELRSQCNGLFSNPRYGEYYAQLMVVAELVFKKYAIETNQLSFEQAEQLLIKFNTYVQDAIYYNNRVLIEKSPIVTLCQAIIIEITENRFPVVPRNAQIDDARHYILEDAERWYIRQGDILTMKNEYEAENGIKRIEVTATRLAKDLCDKEIAMPCDEGKTHRYAKKIGKHRYVVIDKMKLNQVANL